MKTSVIKVSQIKPAAYNPRLDLKPGDKAYEDLKRSIAKFGDVEPIVWNKRTGNLVGGHQRFKILVNEMGHKTVDAVTVDLSSNDEKALNLALNKIGGDWEPGALKALLEELEAAQYDLSLTGFGTEELAEVLAHGLTEGLTDPDAVPEAPKEAITKPGDLWIIGKHRLLCGDSAAERDVRFLVGSERPVLMWTDPPYGVDYVGKTKDALRIKNDGKEGLEMLLSSAFAAADAVLAEGAAIYVAHPAGALSIVFGTCFVLQGWRLHETLVWVKHSMVMGHSDYHYKHEPILFGYRSEHEPIHFGYTEGSGRRGRGGAGWFGDNKQTSNGGKTSQAKRLSCQRN